MSSHAGGPPAPAPTLRARLRDVPPEHVATKRAWRSLLRALRARKRATGHAGVLRGQGDIARALDTPLQAGILAEEHHLRAVKAGLAVLARADTPEADAWVAAAQVDQAVGALVGRVQTEPVPVRVTGWPAGTPQSVIRRLMGGHADRVEPLEAARLVRRLDGLVVAGAPLQVAVQLPPGARLPALPRAERGDRGRWGRGAPWLPHLDEEGRYSLTPATIGRRRARRLGPPVVLDGTAGCGGDALSFALEGAQVHAVEPDFERRGLLVANATHLGVSERVSVHAGLAEEALPLLLAAHPSALVFLDPPWGGPGAGMEGLAAWLATRAALLQAPRWIALKLPRAFPVHSLPARPDPWRVQLELGDEETGDAQVIRMLTVVSGGPQGR